MNNEIETKTNVSESFQSQVNYPPSQFLKIDNMWLSIEPDFASRKVKAKQQLKITVLQDIDKIVLDCAANDTQKLQIESVFSSDAAASDTSNDNRKKLPFKTQEDKLIIEVGETLLEGSRFHLIINYSANGSPPGQGFHFIKRDEHLSKQAWTQGEAIESRNWFPCLDHPQFKFPRQISVIVPENFIVISNGELDVLDQEANEENKKKYVWEEPNANPAYLTSIVIGDFVETSKGKKYKGKIPLRYYVPKGREEDARRTFDDTPKMMEFFERFFDTEYPYSKYSQVTVEDFPYGGMENTTCTTLTTDLLHDERAHLIYSSDDVIFHELAHQWFGDLVTCRDWEHIWLNEGFASYSEALYWEYNRGNKEFQYYVLEMADDYFEEAARLGKRALVTKEYDHPDKLFDIGHTYKKGGCVVHMIRNYIGDNDFKKSLKIYFERYKHKTAETDDLRHIFEEVSGKNMGLFFDQWLYRKGHPEIEVEFSIEESTNNVILKIIQKQDEGNFEFPLEVRLALSTAEGKKEKIETTINISGIATEQVFQIPIGGKVEWFSIDPELKILHEIISTRAPIEMFIRQLENGETVFERIEAARALKNESSDEIIEALKKRVLEDEFWGVSVEAVNVLGQIRSDTAYKALKECLPVIQDPKIRLAIENAIGKFGNADSFELLKQILESKDASYHEQQASAIAIARTGKEQSLPILQKLVDTTTFRNIVAQGAIDGLKIVALDSKDNRIINNIEDLLINKTRYGNESRLRRAAASALGYLGKNRKGEIKNVECLKGLLNDESVHVRNTACAALGNALENTRDLSALAELKRLAEHDPDGQVRMTAKEAIDIIEGNEKVKEDVPTKMGEADRIDSKYKSKKIELMEKRIPGK